MDRYTERYWWWCAAVVRKTYSSEWARWLLIVNVPVKREVLGQEAPQITSVAMDPAASDRMKHGGKVQTTTIHECQEYTAQLLPSRTVNYHTRTHPSFISSDSSAVLLNKVTIDKNLSPQLHFRNQTNQKAPTAAVNLRSLTGWLC